ncbi:uncharacterized protein [Diabrotica undecimpunctata]|uniref:uncharacterized protein isoform X2 n=1 Tax=Diabrotica undecimpunctata TaxID=50387 RepID=UPI003B6367D0
MELSDDCDVDITTFINPHLFWVVVKNKVRKKLLANLDIQIQLSLTEIKNYSGLDIGQMVVAVIDGFSYRAVIEHIDESDKPSYLVWLIDYGTMKEIEKVYEIPASLSKLQHLSFQASLNNAVCMEQFLDYNAVGEVYNVKKPVKNPTTLVIKESLKILSEGHTFKFKLEDKQKDVALGDIFVRDKLNKEASLRDSLVKAGVLDVDHNMFRVLGIMDFINDYKTSWLTLIAKTCKENPYPKNLVAKVLEEFQSPRKLEIPSQSDEPLRVQYSNKHNVTDPDEEGDAANKLQESSDALDYQSVSNESTDNPVCKENSSSSLPNNSIRAMYISPSEKPKISSRKSGSYYKSQFGNNSLSPHETRKTSEVLYSKQYRGFPEVLSDSSLSSDESFTKSSTQEDVSDPKLQDLKNNIKGGNKIKEENITLIKSKERSSLLSSANSSVQENEIEEGLGSTESSLSENYIDPRLQKIQKYIKGQKKVTEESTRPKTSKGNSSHLSNLSLSSTDESFQENEVQKVYKSTEGSAQENISDPRLQKLQNFVKRRKDTIEGNRTLETCKDRLNTSLSSADNLQQENDMETGHRSTECSLQEKSKDVEEGFKSTGSSFPKRIIDPRFQKIKGSGKENKEENTALEFFSNTSPISTDDSIRENEIKKEFGSTKNSVQENPIDPRLQKFIKRGKSSTEENIARNTSKGGFSSLPNTSPSSVDCSVQENTTEKQLNFIESSHQESYVDPRFQKFIRREKEIKDEDTALDISKELSGRVSNISLSSADSSFQKNEVGRDLSSTDTSLKESHLDPRLQKLLKVRVEHPVDPRFQKSIRGEQKSKEEDTALDISKELSGNVSNISLSSADSSFQKNEVGRDLSSTDTSLQESHLDPRLQKLLKLRVEHPVDPRFQKSIKREQEIKEENTALDISKELSGNVSNISLSSADSSFQKNEVGRDLSSTDTSLQETPIDPRFQKLLKLRVEHPVDPRFQKSIKREQEIKEENTALDISKELSGNVSNISLSSADNSFQKNEVGRDLSSTDTSLQETPIDPRFQKLLKLRVEHPVDPRFQKSIKREQESKEENTALDISKELSGNVSNISLSSADNSFQKNEVGRDLSSTDTSLQETPIDPRFQKLLKLRVEHPVDPRFQKSIKREQESKEENTALDISKELSGNVSNISLSSADNSFQKNEVGRDLSSTDTSLQETPIEPRFQKRLKLRVEHPVDPRFQKSIKREQESKEENTALDISKELSGNVSNISLSSADSSFQKNEVGRDLSSTDTSLQETPIDPRFQKLLKLRVEHPVDPRFQKSIKREQEIKEENTALDISKELSGNVSNISLSSADNSFQKNEVGRDLSSTDTSLQETPIDPRFQKLLKLRVEHPVDPRFQKSIKREQESKEENTALDISKELSGNVSNISLSSADNSFQKNDVGRDLSSTDTSLQETPIDPRFQKLLKLRVEHPVDPRFQKSIKREQESKEENTALDISKELSGNVSNISLSSADNSFQKNEVGRDLSATDTSFQENPLDPRLQKLLKGRLERSEKEKTTLDTSKNRSSLSNNSFSSADGSFQANETEKRLKCDESSQQEKPIDPRLRKFIPKEKKSKEENTILDISKAVSNISLSSADSSFQENTSKYRLSHFSNTSLSSADSSSREDHIVIPIRSIKENMKKRDNTRASTAFDYQSEGNSTETSFQENPSLDHSKMNASSTEESCLDTNKPSSVEGTSASALSKNAHTLKIKPHCECKQCTIWTKDENVFVENFGTCRKVARLEGVKPQFLFKEDGNEASNIEICAIEYGSMRRVEKRAMLKLLVHSESIVHPIKEIAKVAFHRDIHHNLSRLQYIEARRIQSYVWPAILRNHHVFMISGPQSGKTMAYLPAMLTFILEKHDRYHSLIKVAGGPIVIILCGSTKKCDELRDLVKIILGNQRAYITVGSYPFVHINTSRTDMLITTPLILVELIKNKSVNFKRLCHLIIEDGDDILSKHKDTMSAIFEMAQSMLKNRAFTKALQLIVCAEQWDSELKYLIKSLQQVPMVCVGSYLEAALYGQVEFSMKFTNSASKDNELKRVLKDTHKIYKSIVLCKDEEIKTIESMFMFNGIECTAIYESLSHEDIMLLEDNWTNAQGGNFSVLVCSDYTLNSFLSVTCAHVLIHYSLPTTWTKFVKRYKCLLESCRSPLETKEMKISTRSVVLCDENCTNQMPKFFRYINSSELKKQLPKQVQEVSESLLHEEEQYKLNHGIPLCTHLKLFGRCIKNLCSGRHNLSSKLDVSDSLPKSGKIKFKIMNILDVALYSIKILQHVDLDNKLVEYDTPDDVTADLNATLRSGKKAVQKPKLGHHYVFYYADDEEFKYSRCELIEILKENMVNIKLLDTGVILNTMLTRLYKLPKEFRCNVRPRAVINAYLASSIPPFQDESFSSRSIYKLMELMEPKDYKNLVFAGEVHLQLDQTLWLKDVYEEVVLNDTIIPGFQLSREVIQRKLVEYYPDQLVNLYKLCIDASIVLPKYVKERVAVSIKKQEVKKQWAYLDRDKVNEVTFTSAFSPNEIFVRLNKYSDLLYRLQNEIQQSLKKPNYPKLKEVNAGGVYLAKDPGGIEYGRVIVLKKEEDRALCFYVDFGDESVIPIEELKYIQDVFVTKLPFQCIQCRLYGINLLGDTWDEEVTNIFYNYAFEPGTDIFRSLYVQVYEKENCDSLTPVKYAVIFKDGFGDKNVLVNKLLIECGMALENPKEKFTDFEIPVVEVESLESDEELDTMAYICNKTDELQQHLHEDGPETSGRVGQGEFAYDSDEMELVVYGELDDFLKQLILGPQPALSGNNELPAITAVPAVDYFTPEVYWSQTETTVALSIKLIDCQDYKISLKMRNVFNFSATQGEKTYSLKLIFFEYVHKMEHMSTGPEVRVTLTKFNKVDWPRLTLSKQKARNIHYDINKVSIDDDDDKPKKILEFPKEFDEMLDDLNENDPMYVEYSDLDSDMDLELENESD